MPGLIINETLSDTPNKIGTRYRQVIVGKGQEIEFMGTITAYAKNRHMSADFTTEGFGFSVEYILQRVSGTKTKLTQHTQYQFRVSSIIMTPVMWLLSKFKDPQAAVHAKLKEMAEAEFRAAYL